MDSKIRRMAILASMGVILLVSLLVLYANGDQGGQAPKGTGRPPAESRQEEGQQDPGKSGVVNGQIGDDLSAFLKDDTFFDPESNPILEAARDNASRLSMMVTSVEKDLRIQIVDTQGELVTGESFLVRLDGLGEYKDLDKDGVIYIGDLSAGEYYVELMPMEGYRMPENGTKVRVKDKVEYVAIDDISLLLLTEADIDVAAEDTEVADAIADADATEISQLQTSTANSRVGIDVSKWNGEIDWEVVKAEGVDFAIIRCGYRGSSSGWLLEDPYFYKNLTGAKKAGIKVGLYFFTQATNLVEAVEEASMVVSLLGDTEIEYPVFIDTEGAGGNGRADNLDPGTRTAVVNAFCQTIQNAGLDAGVYSGRNWFYNNLIVDEMEAPNVWLAEYRQTPLYEGRYDMWQYTSSGSVAGIEGRVDLNISYLGIE